MDFRQGKSGQARANDVAENMRLEETIFVDPLIHFNTLVKSSNRTVSNTSHSLKKGSFFFCFGRPTGAFR